MQGNHDVSVKLKFGADTAQASKAVKDLERQTKDLDKATKEANREMARMGGPGGASNFPGGASASGGSGNFAGMAKFATVTYVAAKAMEGLAKSIEILGDKSLSTSQKLAKGVEAILQEIPIVNSLAQASKMLTTEIFYGSDKRAYNQQQLNERAAGEVLGIAGQSLDQMLPAKMRQVTARSQADDMIFAANREIAGIAGGSAFGGLGLGALDLEDPRVRAARRAKLGAVSESNQAFERKRLLTGFQGQLQSGLDGLEAERAAIEARRPSAANKYQQGQIESELRQKDMEILAQKVRLQDVINQKNQAGLDLEQKRFDVKKRELDIQRAELQVITEKEQKARGNEESFAAMSAGDKLGALYALQDVQKRGIAAQPQEVRDLLLNNPLTSEYTRKLIGKEADTDPVLAQVARLIGAERASDLGKKRLELNTKIELQVNVDTKDFAQSVRKAADATFDEVNKIIESVFETKFKMLTNPPRQLP